MAPIEASWHAIRRTNFVKFCETELQERPEGALDRRSEMAHKGRQGHILALTSR